MYFRTGDRLAKIRFWPDDIDNVNLSFSNSSLQVCTEGYWARRAPIFPYVHKWRETVTVEKTDLAAYVLKVPYHVLSYRRLAG